VGPEDLLTVQVYDAPDITGDYRVSSTGQIELPLLPEAIVAAGLTPAQLSERIGEQYQTAEIVSHPRVTVTLKEPRVHSITIAGAVKQPQIYSTSGTTTLVDALSQAGGLADDASTTATVTRGELALRALKQSGACDAAGGQPQCAPSFSVDLKQLMEAGDPALNVQMYPGDRVDVQHAGIVYVIGAVNRPGGFPLKTGQDDMTLIWALALAQDFTPTASKSKAMIIRKNPAEKNGRVEIPVNLKQVLAGKNDDLKLQANDILYVMDSTAKRALHRGTDAAVQAATYGVVYHW
jgi:polysaccharide export outer membrane protein